MKGDITIRPSPARDAKLEKIAARHGMTINALFGLIGQQFSNVPPDALYQCLAAITDRVEDLKERKKKKPDSTDKHQQAP
jgi:hypothetical protein